MKRFMFLTIVVVLFVASSVSAVLPPVGYIGLFTDPTHTCAPPLSVTNTVCPAPNGLFSCWIWCLPSVNGWQGAEFAVKFPATVVTFNFVRNSALAFELGTFADGISLFWGDCQTDWVWTHVITMTLLAAVPSKIEIIPHPLMQPVPAYQFKSCLPGYPIEPCIYLTPLYICWTPNPGPLGVQETNWGAIKNLF